MYEKFAAQENAENRTFDPHPYVVVHNMQKMILKKKAALILNMPNQGNLYEAGN